jgi:hypothetical protein
MAGGVTGCKLCDMGQKPENGIHIHSPLVSSLCTSHETMRRSEEFWRAHGPAQCIHDDAGAHIFCGT